LLNGRLKKLKLIISGALDRDQKAIWKFIHSKNGKNKNYYCSVNGQHEMSSGTVAENFAKTFSVNFNTSFVDNDLYISNQNNNSANISDVQFTERDVCKLLKMIRLNSSAGPDNIPPYILNQVADALCSSLYALNRKSLTTGCVPD
jgi:hypothetical protein